MCIYPQLESKAEVYDIKHKLIYLIIVNNLVSKQLVS